MPANDVILTETDRAAIEDELDRLIPPLPQEEDPCRTCVVLDGLPIVGQDKYERLMLLLQKICSSVGQAENITLPSDPATGETQG